MSVNGEAPTSAKPSSAILQAAGVGSTVTLELTSEPKQVSTATVVGESGSVSMSQSKDRPVPGAVRARDSQKMRRASELLDSWKLNPAELVYGEGLTPEPSPYAKPSPSPDRRPNPDPNLSP